MLIIEDIFDDYRAPESLFDEVIREMHDQFSFATEFWAPPAALLYRREIVDRIGGWPAGLPVIQDARYLFEAARRNARFAYVAGVGAYYRVSSNRLSRRNLSRFIGDCARHASEIEAIW